MTDKTSDMLIRLPEDLKALLADTARREDMSMAQIVRRALKLYLESPGAGRKLS